MWKSAVIIAVGLAGGFFLPPSSFEDVTQELMAFFGLIMAGVLPTMVLTASVLRAGNLSVKRLEAYSAALRRQMTIWIGMFLVSLFACMFIIVGKMLAWNSVLSFDLDLIGVLNGTTVEFDGIRIVNSCIAMALMLFLVRALSVGNGLISLLKLSTELAISEAVSRDAAQQQAVETVIKQLTEREGFGSYVELKH